MEKELQNIKEIIANIKTDEEWTKIANGIAFHRKGKKLIQPKVAEMLGISKPAYQRKEKEPWRFTLLELRQLKRLYNLKTIDELLRVK